MKKQMALTLAGVMAMSTLPMSVFAAANAEVNVKTTATLAANSDRQKTMFVTSAAGLTVEDSDYVSKEKANAAGYEVVNAPFIRVSGITSDVVNEEVTFEINMNVADSTFKWNDKNGSDAEIGAAIGQGVKVARQNVSNRLLVTIPGSAFATTDTKVSLNIPVIGVVNSNKAPLTATVKPVSTNSNIVTVTTTVATVNESTGGNTTTSVASSFTGKTGLKFDLLTKENNAGVFGSDSFVTGDVDVEKYKLPREEFYADKVTYTATSGFEFDYVKDAELGDLNKDTYTDITTFCKFDYNVVGRVYAKIGSSENKLDVIYAFDAPTTVATSVLIDDIYFETPDRSTSFQDVKITVTPQGDSDVSKQSDLKVGTYTDYKFASSLYNTSVEIPTLPAGSLGFTPLDSNKNPVGSTDLYDVDADIFDTDATKEIAELSNFDEVHETVALKLSESVLNSIVAGRTVDFILPEGVEIVGYEVIFNENGLINADNAGKHYFTDDLTDVYFDENVLSFENVKPTINNVAQSGKVTMAIKFYVAADANYTGDVDVVVAGDALSGVELEPVTVATLAPAITIETKATNVKPGVQATATADIVLKETENGRFQDGEIVYVQIDTENYATLSKALTIVDADYEITGDLSIKNFKVNNTSGLVQFEVNGTSSEPATITLKDVKVSTAYGLPDTNVAPFQVKVTTDGGDETTTNNFSNDKVISSTINFGELSADYVNIKSNSGAAAGDVVEIQPGSTTYLVNGEERTMDVAPFIDATSQSMMVPVRFIADGVGITEESGGLQWSATNKTVVIRNDKEILEFPVGANFYRVNGVRVDNENGAVTQIVDGRTFVPFRTMGNALGIPVSWNPDTRTAQYN